MKKITLLFSVLAAAFTVSCVHVTEDLDEVYAEIESSVVYHDKKYMKSRDMEVPNGVDENKFKKEKLRFTFSFGQNEKERTGISKKGDTTYLDSRDWDSLRSQFETKIQRSERFLMGQFQYMLGTGEGDIQKGRFDGTNNADEFDPSKMDRVEGDIRITYIANVIDNVSKINFFRGGGQRRERNLMLEISCLPKYIANNQPIPGFPSFVIQNKGIIYNREDSNGNPDGGVSLDRISYSSVYQCQWDTAIIQIINQLYTIYPVGGPIVNFDPNDGYAVIQTSRDEGAQPKMEFVIYARKKADGDAALRIPLFNASMVTLGASGTSTLKIWRKNTSSKTAKEIIKKIYSDFNSAKTEYDFFGCSDGLAEWPEEIIQSKSGKKR